MANPLGLSIKVTSDYSKAASRASRAIDQKIDGSFRYIAGAIRRTAKKSIKRGTKNKPHSEPGKAANSRTKILKNTIERHYDKTKKELIVGPKTTGFTPKNAKPVGKTVPELLEDGGKINAPKATVLPASNVDIRARRIAVKKKRQQLRKKKLKGRFGMKDLKWVVIPAGTRTVDSRPTMKLAFAKTLTAKNLKQSFDNVGIKVNQAQ